MKVRKVVGQKYHIQLQRQATLYFAHAEDGNHHTMSIENK
jgi:hypothetical protein